MCSNEALVARMSGLCCYFTSTSRAAFVLFVILGGTTGCGDAGRGSDTDRTDRTALSRGYTIEDSSGVRITEVQLEYEELPEWQLSDGPLLVIDGAGREGGPFLERITSAAWSSDGGIVVLDRQADQLHLFARDGSPARSFGRSGDGPGEFGNIATVTVAPDDSVFVFDRGHDRVTVFHPSVGYVRDLDLRNSEAGLLPTDVWSLGQNRLLLSTHREDLGWTENYDGQPFVAESEIELTVHDETGMVRAGPLVLPGERFAQFSWGSGGLPLAPEAHVAAGGGLMVYGTGGETITLMDGDLRAIGLLRWPNLRQRITEADRDEVRTRIVALFGEVMPERVDEIIEVSLSEEAASSLRPGHGRLVLGSDSSVWVSRFEPYDEPRSWHVFDDQGRPAGRLLVPPRARLLAAKEDRVLFTIPDSLDVPSVYVFGVERR
jgi:hypothetical protein